MIFNTSKVDKKSLKPVDKKKWKLGVLDIEPESSNSLPFVAHDYSKNDRGSFTSFAHEFMISSEIIEILTGNQNKDRTKPNP